jgi:hypothetical protein
VLISRSERADQCITDHLVRWRQNAVGVVHAVPDLHGVDEDETDAIGVRGARR